MPRGTSHGYRVKPGGTWRTCWIIGQDPSIIDVYAPTLRRVQGQPLAAAIAGLLSEHAGECVPDLLTLWADLIQSYAARIGKPTNFPNHRPQTVWERVALDVSRDWDLRTLAGIACLSEERQAMHLPPGDGPHAHAAGDSDEDAHRRLVPADVPLHDRQNRRHGRLSKLFLLQRLQAPERRPTLRVPVGRGLGEGLDVPGCRRRRMPSCRRESLPKES